MPELVYDVAVSFDDDSASPTSRVSIRPSAAICAAVADELAAHRPSD